MSFGLYVHIPFCKQKCIYCNFATLPKTPASEFDTYLDSLLAEIENRHGFFDKTKPLSSIYFGGGTPSLFSPLQLSKILSQIKKVGFKKSFQAEVTIEINPGTLEQKKLDGYLKEGINRFSLGAQTFNDGYLKRCGREHSAQETKDCLKLLKTSGVNYSFDLLFALPKQSLEDLKKDLDLVLFFEPPHLSTYSLTVPSQNPLFAGQPKDSLQIKMFQQIKKSLASIGLKKYEISNFAKPGFESRHNLLYWNNLPYWGIGLSSHSYLPEKNLRFWNPRSLSLYSQQVHQKAPGLFELLPSSQRESLKIFEKATDILHTFLRQKSGLPLSALQQNFPSYFASVIENKLGELIKRGWIQKTSRAWRLTEQGELLANQVFLSLTFTEEPLPVDRREAKPLFTE